MVRVFLLALLTVGITAGAVLAQTPAHDAAKAELDRRAEATGNVDVYDDKGKKVRHLKFIELHPEAEETKGGPTVVKADMEDQYSKEIVTITLDVRGETVGAPAIAAVNKPDPAAVKNVTDMADEEVKDLFKKLLAERAEDDGRFVYYDPAIKALRFLEMVGLAGEPRKFGKIAIVAVEYKDAARNEKVMMDATLENTKKGAELTKLKLKSATPL